MNKCLIEFYILRYPCTILRIHKCLKYNLDIIFIYYHHILIFTYVYLFKAYRDRERNVQKNTLLSQGKTSQVIYLRLKRRRPAGLVVGSSQLVGG